MWWSLSGRRWAVRTLAWLGCAGLSFPAAAVPRDGFAPFTNEAGARGVQFNIAPTPQPGGVYGYPAAWVDIDGDQDADLIAGVTAGGKVGLWENLGGTFVSRAEGSGLPTTVTVCAIAAADFDADGDADLLLTRWGEPALLLRQSASFVFEDITDAAGIQTSGPARCASWADVNGDGWLDLFIAQYAGLIAGTLEARSHLYIQVPYESRFVESGASLGVGDPAYTFLGAFIDVDRDTRNDLVVSNDRGFFAPHFQGNQAWHNGPNGLMEVSQTCGLGAAFYSMGCGPADFNRDGLIDLAFSNISDPNQPIGPINPLFIATAPWLYTEQSVTWQFLPPGTGITGWSVQAQDFDNDGWTDIAINNQFHANRLYRNSGMGHFFDVTLESAFSGPNKPSFCSASADFDRDGDVDLVSMELGTSLRLLVNHEGEERSSLGLSIVGMWPNTGAIGALVDVSVDEVTQIGQVMAGGHGYLGQNELTVHVGLGSAGQSDEIVVQWPYGSAARTLSGLPAGRWRVYPPARLGDADGDYEVDDADLAPFIACRDGTNTGDCAMFDFDGNGQIDASDQAAFDARRAQSPADFDGSGHVSAADLAIVLSHWGEANPIYMLGTSDAVGGEELARVLSDWSE